jgi:simple sugar transport system ATP-binding protein
VFELGATVKALSVPVGDMSGGQKQSVAVARAASWANKIIFLDEPTAALGVVQTHNVLELIKRVRDKGIGVVFISHSMPEVLSVADSVQVLRRGRRVMTLAAKSTTLEELVGAMTGALDEEVR